MTAVLLSATLRAAMLMHLLNGAWIVTESFDNLKVGLGHQVQPFKKDWPNAVG
jgi:hypothetical protein